MESIGLTNSKTNDHDTIARVAHEAMRAYKAGLGEERIPDWDEAPQWMRDSTLEAVRSRIEATEAPPSAQHEAWMAEKEAAGWCYGPVKDAENKTHPMMVPYEELPTKERYKDALIQSVIDALSRPIL